MKNKIISGVVSGVLAISSPSNAEQVKSDIEITTKQISDDAIKSISSVNLSEEEKIMEYNKKLEELDEQFLKLLEEEDFKNFKKNKNSHFEPPYELIEKYLLDFEKKSNELKAKFKEESFKKFEKEATIFQGSLIENDIFILTLKFLLENKPQEIDTGIENNGSLRKVLIIGQTHMADNMSEGDAGLMGESQALIRNFLKYFQKDDIEVGVEGVEFGNEEVLNDKYIFLSILTYIDNFGSREILKEDDYKIIKSEFKKIKTIRGMNPYTIYPQGIKIDFSWDNEDELLEMLTYKRIIEKLTDLGLDLNKVLETSNGVAKYKKDGGKISVRGIEYKDWGSNIGPDNPHFKIKNMNAIDFHDTIFGESGIIFEYFFEYAETLIKNGNIDEDEKAYLEKILSQKKYFHLDGDYLINLIGEEKFLTFREGLSRSRVFSEFKDDVLSINELGGNELTNREIKDNLEKFIKKYNISNKELEKSLKILVLSMTNEQSIKRETSAIRSMSMVDKSQRILPFVMGYGHLKNFKDTARLWNQDPKNEKFNFEYLDLSSYKIDIPDDTETIYD